MSIEWRPDGRPQGLYLSPRQDSHHILSPLAPTIRRIGPQSPCIVGAGEDVDVGMGPLWLPVRAHHHISSRYLKCIGPCGRPPVEARRVSSPPQQGLEAHGSRTQTPVEVQQVTCPPHRVPTRGPTPPCSSPAPT